MRRRLRGFAVVGLVGCIALIVTLPVAAVITGTAVLALGVVVRRVTEPDHDR